MCFREAVFTMKLGVSDSQLPCYWNSWADPAPPSSSSHSFLKGYPLQQGGGIPEIPNSYQLPILARPLGFLPNPFPGIRGLGTVTMCPPHHVSLCHQQFHKDLSRACFLSVWPREGAAGTRAHTVRPSGPNSVLARTTNPDILRNHMDRITSYPQLTNGLGYCNQ